MTIEIEGCKDCWLMGRFDTLPFCDHPMMPPDNELFDLETVPEWCPLHEESVELKLKESNESKS